MGTELGHGAQLDCALGQPGLDRSIRVEGRPFHQPRRIYQWNFVSRHLARDRQLALRPLGLCRGDGDVGGYPRYGFLSFFHGPSHIGHQSFEVVL